MGRDLQQRVEGNAVAQGEAPSIGQMIQNLRPEIARALPKHMDADRMARIALTVLRHTPKLAQSTPQSFMGALLSAAQLGLEPGVSDEAYLVPYEFRSGRRQGEVECQLIIGYQGYAKLFWQHPMAKHLDSQAVYPEDDFDYAYGLDPFLRHKPSLNRSATSQPIAYYAVASLTSGGSAFVVLSADQVKALRGGKTGSSGDIPDPMHWMERKTAVRQLVKLLPKSPNLARAVAVDETVRTDLREDAIDAPVHDLVLGSTATDAAPEPPAEPPAERPQERPAPARAARGGATQAQLGALHALLHKAVGNDRNAGLTLVAQELGLESLASTDALTKAQASTAIDKVQALVDAQQPQGEAEWPPVAEPGAEG